MGGAATDDRAFDNGTAGVAGLAGAAEDLYVHVLAPFVAIAIDVVAEACPAVGNPAFQNCPGGSVEPGDGGSGDGPRRGVGADAGFVERFVDVDVAEAREPALVEEDGLDRRGAPFQDSAEVGEAEVAVDRLRAEPGGEGGDVVEEIPGAELAEVRPAQVVAVVERNLRALVLLRRIGRLPPEHPAGHAEMGDEGSAVVEREEQVLAATAEGGDGPADEFRREDVLGDANEEMRRARIDGDASDGAADDVRFEVAANGLDFREFGHRGSLRVAGWMRWEILTIVITHLQGSLARMDISGPTVELDVAGVRYEVLVPLVLWPDLQALAGEADLGEVAERPTIGLHIFYHATANQPVPVLVGFLRRAERDFFRKFTTVEGIGPTKAVKAMNVSVSTIARAIEQDDKATLTRLPGVGARAAEKMIATLRGKLLAEAALQDGERAVPVDAAHGGDDRAIADAVETIAALGYPKGDARRWVDEVREAEPELRTVEELTLAVLRRRGAQ